MTAGLRRKRPRWLAVTVAVCLFAMAVEVTAGAAEPRDVERRPAARQSPAPASRPSRLNESARPRDDVAPRQAAERETRAEAAPSILPPSISVFGDQQVGPNPRAAKNSATPTTQKSASRTPSGGFDPTRIVIALGVVLALILLLRWFGKKLFGTAAGVRSTRAVQVLSRSPVSPRQQLVLLRVGRRLLVVADGGGQMNTLSEITDADEVAALLGQLQDDHAGRMTTTFGNLFGKMRAPFEGDSAMADATPERESEEDEPKDDELVRRPAARDRTEEDDPAVESTRQELSGLMDKVRLLSRQFKSP